MQQITINAAKFFEILKLRDTSMWQIFAEMIDGKEKELIFLDDEEKILFNYILPENLEKLQEDQKLFSKEYGEKIAKMN